MTSRRANIAKIEAFAATAALATSIVSAACEPARDPSAATISLRLRGQPADATVLVDDEALGSLEFVAAHGVALPPGVHHVTVTAPGYFPWDHEVEAHQGNRNGNRGPPRPMAFEVVLMRVPD